MKEAVYHIGRNKNSNEIYVFNETVSSSHAQIIIDENGDLIIIDLSSKNGVSVNNEKIVSPVKLFKDDLITIGEFKCTQADLLNAVRVFEFKNQKPGEVESVPLESSVNPQMDSYPASPGTKWYQNKKLMIIILVVLGLVILAIGTKFLIDQQSIKKAIEKKSIVEKTTKESDENKTKKKKKKNNTNSKTSKFKKQRTDVAYDFSCLTTENDRGSNKVIFNLGEFTRNVENTILNDVQITLSEEKEAGDALIKDLKESYTFNDNGSEYSNLNGILKDLEKRLANPRGVNYEMHFVDDTIVNVFTLGGHIIFFKGMYEVCETNSELASIISHEIAHNELGHSTLALKKLKKVKELNIPSEIADIALTIESVITTSFNQKQETEADFFGMDIMYPSSYKTCEAVSLWKRMSDNETSNFAENFFRSHPYASSRANCVKNHLKSNYNKECNN